MQYNTPTPPNLKQVPESKTNPDEGLPSVHEIRHDPHKEEVKEKVKESFKDEHLPGEPVLGDDGDEVGGEG